jgi:hypothetical protein
LFPAAGRAAGGSWHSRTKSVPFNEPLYIVQGQNLLTRFQKRGKSNFPFPALSTDEPEEQIACLSLEINKKLNTHHEASKQQALWQ